MYLLNIFCVVLSIFGPALIGGLQVSSGTHSAKPSWIYNQGHHLEDVSNDKDNHQHHHQAQHPTQQQTQPLYTSQYPSEYTPYYPPQYTPPYPTQSKPQAPTPTQFKPPQIFQSTSKPHQHPTQAQLPHQAHNQILYPSINPKPTLSNNLVVNQFNHRYPDGSYEFRYELPDETVRYERGYFIRFHHEKSLVVRGYYSYRLPPGNRYLTVFYTADHFGFRQDSFAITQQRPQLPRSLGERRILEDEEEINVVSSINENKLE